MEKVKVPYNYLGYQFIPSGDLVRDILADIGKLVETGEFTLGPQVAEFEEKFAAMCGVKYAVGINSGTDSLTLILKALDIGPGDEVITAPNSFIATANVIALVGAKPVFADVDDEYLLDAGKVAEKVTEKTRAILPVHLTGNPVFMPEFTVGSFQFKKGGGWRGIFVIEDAAQAIGAEINGKKVGNWGIAGEFSLHPLKNMNVWGDGGVVTTNNDELADKIRLLRNHGLATRDECVIVAGNCRLHTIQAVVGLKLMPYVREVSDERIKNATLYDQLLKNVDGVTIPPRYPNKRQVYHTYVIQVERREQLIKFLADSGVETKVHYPIPIHLQVPYRAMGYKEGNFPVCEAQAKKILSLPIHQYLSRWQIQHTADLIRAFYGAPAA